MKPTKVLIVDDSAVVRRMLSDILSSEPGVEVVGSASDATQALSKLDSSPPDVVTLDVEMPGVSGLDLLALIRKRSPRLPVIMFSSLTQRAGAITLEALARGATDYVTKPVGTSSRQEASDHIRRELVPRIRALGARSSARVTTTSTHPAPKLGATQPRAERRQAELVAIGCSTGGPNALTDLFSDLPPALAVPIVIVQHMPPLFTNLLAERLSALGRIPVREAKDGDELRVGVALIAPGGYHMRISKQGARYVARLDQGPLVNSCRPAVDNLFESATELMGADVLGVVLTGMGQDGLRGCERIREKGGQVVVQDEATSVVWGMPGFVAKAGLAHAVLPLRSIAAEILTRVTRDRGRFPGYANAEELNV